MKKMVKDLLPGDVFLDSFGLKLSVLKVKELSGRMYPECVVDFVTERGNVMHQRLRSDRSVKVVEVQNGKSNDS